MFWFTRFEEMSEQFEEKSALCVQWLASVGGFIYSGFVAGFALLAIKKMMMLTTT